MSPIKLHGHMMESLAFTSMHSLERICYHGAWGRKRSSGVTFAVAVASTYKDIDPVLLLFSPHSVDVSQVRSCKAAHS